MDDWRLTGQEAYLTGVVLCWRSYPETSDHDHCEFCGAKFAPSASIPDALHAGYTTVDAYRWVCGTCFDDFRERFEWTMGDCDD